MLPSPPAGAQRTVVVPAPAEVDLATEAEFGAALRAAVAAAAPQDRVVVDFSGVGFCDSAAVNALLHAASAADAAGCSLEVRDPHPLLVRMLDLLELRDRLPLQRVGR